MLRCMYLRAARRLLLRACLFAVSLVMCSALAAAQGQRAEYRAFWVDTFNTTLNNHTDVATVVSRAKAANANAIFAQVRRRGDAWYITPLEPKFANIAAGFDPLADLVNEAHANGIEVHAFVIMGAIWTSAAAPPNVTLPTSPLHAFNQHGGYDPVTKTIMPGPDNWLTRTLLADGGGITFQGHRFGNDFWLDFGHPDAAAFTVDVMMHLVRNYNIDGLHLDRIRYPEFAAAGQTPANGTNIGYNPTNVERFNARHDRTGTPATGDPLWMQWRRDQVSNVVRRVYLNAVAEKPHLKISGALIAFGGGPACAPGPNCQTDLDAWRNAEAYWRVYQDWRAWTEEGILDLAVPMNYKREHLAAQATQFAQWSNWLKDHQYDRAGLIGLGAFINPIEGTLRQVRSSIFQPSPQGNHAQGVVFFSMANSNSAATNGVTATPIANPFSIPPNQVTGVRVYNEFASALATGKSAGGLTLYEDPATNPEAVFSQPANIPVHPWKAAPTRGHLMGFARRADATTLDTAIVTITNLDTNDTRTTATDGGGFYGGVDLAPGPYLVKAELGADVLYTCTANVSAGSVTTADAAPETTAPASVAALAPSTPNGLGGWYTTDVTVTLDAEDDCSGVASTEYSLDGGATWTPYTGAFIIDTEGTTNVLFRSSDRAGNAETPQTVTVKLDKTAPTLALSATPNVIWPPHGQTVNVTLGGDGADAVSGLASVTYLVADEYGTPLSVPFRSLSGASASWADALAVEARREGDDLDGRLYHVTATLTDAAGHTATATVDIVVPHDQRQ
ncbi:MAG TPA: family 10 glycosylhydrolase [Pyrinomonadaceae bacterium]